MYTQNPNTPKANPTLLKAINLMLAGPKEIKEKVENLHKKYNQRYRNTVHPPEFNDWVTNHLILSYSTKAGISGGATSIVGIVPGAGTAIKIFGGTTADIALCMKYQIEMTMALAHHYGHDIESEIGRNRHFIIAGLSTIKMEVIKESSAQAAHFFSILANRYLRQATFDVVRVIFKKVSITLSKRALQKAIPFGIGAAISFMSNKLLTKAVGQRANAFFASLSPSEFLTLPNNTSIEKITL